MEKPRTRLSARDCKVRLDGPNQVNTYIAGFGIIDTLEGVEIAGVTPHFPPEAPPADDFPAVIMYGMAGLAAAAGIAFFVNNRLLKNKQG